METSNDTLNKTTQRGVQISTEPVYIRVIVDNLYLHHKRLNRTWYEDTLIYKVKSILENTVANVYTQGNFIKVYPITARREAGQSLIDFTDNVGVPETLLTDGVGEFTDWNTDFVKHARWVRMQLQNSE